MRLAFLSIGRHIHTERWIRWFARRGHDCHLLTVQPGPVDDVTVHDIRLGTGPKPWRYYRTLAKVRRILGRLEPDLLNTHFLTGYGYWGHFSGHHPNVLTVWGDDVYVTPFENRLKLALARAALRSCDALTGDSADILAVAAELGADPEKSFRILWGVDFEVFRPGAEADWRAARGFGPEDIVYFSPRSYTQPYYNIDVVIAAAARVRDQEPRARFLFSGYEGDPEPFRRRVEAAGIADVTHMAGRLAHDEFAVALRAADVFISVPSVDATAVSLLEAMSSEAAIIVSSLPSSLEWVADEASALVVPPRSEDGLVRAMLRFGADAGLRARCGAAALASARSRVGFEANMELVAAVFGHLTGSDPWPSGASLAALRREAGV
ncbi:glycosyltransferase [bacterium]|nr:glycosyltransferase [bacterium]